MSWQSNSFISFWEIITNAIIVDRDHKNWICMSTICTFAKLYNLYLNFWAFEMDDYCNIHLFHQQSQTPEAIIFPSISTINVGRGYYVFETLPMLLMFHMNLMKGWK